MRKKRRKKNLRRWRKLKVVLLSVGCMGSVIGLALVSGIPFGTSEARRKFGLLYLGIAIGVLLIRQIISIVDERSKRRRRKT